MSSFKYSPGETRQTTGAGPREQDWHKQHNGTDDDRQGDFGQAQAADESKRSEAAREGGGAPKERKRDEETAGQQIPGKPISDMDPPGQANH